MVFKQNISVIIPRTETHLTDFSSPFFNRSHLLCDVFEASVGIFGRFSHSVADRCSFCHPSTPTIEGPLAGPGSPNDWGSNSCFLLIWYDLCRLIPLLSFSVTSCVETGVSLISIYAILTLLWPLEQSTCSFL